MKNQNPNLQKGQKNHHPLHHHQLHRDNKYSDWLQRVTNQNSPFQDQQQYKKYYKYKYFSHDDFSIHMNLVPDRCLFTTPSWKTSF